MMLIFAGLAGLAALVAASRRVVARLHRRRLGRREEGVALISVVIILAVMGANAADFAYNARVDYTSAINARDDLQAHYHARSSINLARLLLLVQKKLIDPNRKYFGGMDIQIADYAPLLLSAFNNKEGAIALGSILGLEAEGIKGLGVEVGSFDLEMDSLDGKVNLNCGGGSNTGLAQVTDFAAALAAMMLSERYNRLFEEPDANGQYADRLEVMRAIIDWADQDTVMFGSTAAEDYRYSVGKDPYENKDQYFDTVQELRLVKGIDEDFMAAFGRAFTVYGSCKVNVGLAGAPVITALILRYAATQTDPALHPRNLTLLVRYVIMVRDMMGGFTNAKAFIQAVENPMAQLGVATAMDSLAGGDQSGQPTGLPPVLGVKLDSKKLSAAITAGGSRRIWRVVGKAEVGRVKKKIIAVWDTDHIPSHPGRYDVSRGAFLYWREE